MSPVVGEGARARMGGVGREEDMFESFGRILREEGWRGLYGGKCGLFKAPFSPLYFFRE